MSDTPLRHTPTHAAEEFPGQVLGIHTPLFAWVGLALLASLALFAWLFYSLGHDFLDALTWAVLPLVIVIAYLRFGHQGKPPGHLRDQLSSRFTGGHAVPPGLAQQHQRLRSSILPDGYLVDGLVVFDGPAGGRVAMGFALDLPDLQTAPFEERNRAQDLVASLLRQLPPQWTLQVQMYHDRGGAARLLTYQQETERCTNPTARRLRNANFIRLWQQLESGALRWRQTVVFVGCALAPSAVPWDGADAEKHHAQVLADARHRFLEWQTTLNELVQALGGHCRVLGDADIARLWASHFNPSLAERVHGDPAANYDLQASLLDNCWHSDWRGQGRQGLLIDGWLHLAFNLKRLPGETYFTIIQRLTHLPFTGFTVTAQVRHLDKDQVLKRTQTALDRMQQQLAHKANERLSVAAGQLQEKIRRLASGEVIPLEFELVVIVRAKTPEELSAKAVAIKSAFAAMDGAQCYEANLPATVRNLLVRALPGAMHSGHPGYVHYGEDRYVADLLPVASSFAGHPGPVEALFTGADGAVVNVVTHLGEGSASTPQNLIIIGVPGGGKSLFLLKLLLETLIHYIFTVIIEEGLAQAPYTRSFGVEPIVFRLDGTQTINAFDTQGLPLTSFVLATLVAMIARMVGLPQDEAAARRLSALIARHITQLCADHADQQLKLWPASRREALQRHAFALDRWATEQRLSESEAFLAFRDWQQQHPEAAAARLAQPTETELREFAATHQTEIQHLLFAHLQPEEHLTLSALREYLLFPNEDTEECRWLTTLLVPWCRGGNCGVLFDGASNVSLTGPVVHFELGQIPDAAKEIKAVVGFLVINGVRQHILGLPRRMRKRAIIEEVSRFLEVPGSEVILRELFEQFRKHNTQITLVAQSYSRLADTSIRTALVGNARAWLIGNTGDRRDIERLGQDIGLSRVAQEAILHFPRPDQQTGDKYSEFLYWHTGVRQPICGVVRYFLLPHELPAAPAAATATAQP